ncbi:MAG: flagellar hook-basal body complex protein FliE [Calditrichaeota bacterium]|nr:MAG: flagellar hook-basal body complex protein FliE [Calditrichota bacterium]
MIDKIQSTLSVQPNIEQVKKQDASDGASFADTFKEAIEGVNDLQQDAASTAEMLVKGEITDLHQVMIAAEKARVGLELLLEIRNKLLEGYQEIMRMQL